MPEAIIRRFRGFATDLPDINNGAFAEDVRNVYERTPGELVRREGCRRAIEFKADGPIRMILPLVEPGGEYTGSGMDLLLQAGGDIVGESSPRSNITPSSPTTPSGGASVDYSPAIDSVSVTESLVGVVANVIFLHGRNFDAEPATPIRFSGRNITKNAALATALVQYISPALVRVAWSASSIGTSGLLRGQIGSFTLTNPDGQSDTFQGVVNW